MKKNLNRPQREVNEMCIIEVMSGYLNPMWALNMYANSTKQELNYTLAVESSATLCISELEDRTLDEAICVRIKS